MSALLGVCLLIRVLEGFPQPDHTVIYPRLICIVPMIGSGTMQDPLRPLFSPNLPQPGTTGEQLNESS